MSIYIFTKDEEVLEFLDLPKGREYDHAFAYSMWSNTWYMKLYTNTLSRVDVWAPINGNDAPERFRSHIKLVKLLS